MAKDLNNLVEVLDLTKHSIEEIHGLLNEGKTLLVALENGEHVQKSLENGFSGYLQANVELKEQKENCGVCGCVVDMQYDFVMPDGKLYVPQAETLIKPINEKIKEYKDNKQLVVYSMDDHPEGHVSFEKWGEHCLKNSNGSKIVVNIEENDYLIRKGTKIESDSYSAYYIGEGEKSELESILQKHNIFEIELCGVAGDVCVKATYDDLKNNYKCSVNQKLIKNINSVS
ncbi:hypothetical protein FQR65_LT16468 [Abscondita terminalis]|nr:hypothetical protein FQR65_LT16468 [Abscondita terminalis]